jgi:hypothetical protein
LEEQFEVGVHRLNSIQDRLDDIGREEGHPEHPAQIGVVDLFNLSEFSDRGV